MPLPQNTRTWLESSRLPYQLETVEHIEPLQRWKYLRDHALVHAELLHDRNGQLLALIPGDTLLDLQALNDVLGRELVAAPRADVAQLCASLELGHLSSVPGVLDIPAIADTSLRERTALLFTSGSADTLVSISRDALAGLPAQTLRFARFAVALTDCRPATESSHDVEAVGASVAKHLGRTIQARLQDTLNLPPLRESARRILQLSLEPEPNFDELVRIIERDPSLTAQIMAWALSPVYSAGRNVNSIRDAIFRVLGCNLVMNIALGLALGKSLRPSTACVDGNLGFWRQAVYSAVLMERLARELKAEKRPGIGIAYLSGLLHNFGYLLLGAVYHDDFAIICRYQEVNRHLGHGEIEQFVLGITRDQISCLLLREWGLPEELCLAIRHQEDASYRGASQTLANLLCITESLLREYRPTDHTPEPLSVSLAGSLGIGIDRLREIACEMLGSADQLDAMAQQLAL